MRPMKSATVHVGSGCDPFEQRLDELGIVHEPPEVSTAASVAGR
jgi:hypothetical protein